LRRLIGVEVEETARRGNDIGIWGRSAHVSRSIARQLVKGAVELTVLFSLVEPHERSPSAAMNSRKI
jgi:hypothetical protein